MQGDSSVGQLKSFAAMLVFPAMDGFFLNFWSMVSAQQGHKVNKVNSPNMRRENYHPKITIVCKYVNTYRCYL